jgi:hypothetical protein
MDECVARVMSIRIFAKDFGTEAVAVHLAESELRGKTWLLRSGIAGVLEATAAAMKAGQIYGAFLYSNNGSSTTVRCVVALLNILTERATGVRPFLYGFSRDAAARTGQREKSYADLCNCLHVVDAPLPTTKDDLLFFDDLDHILATEIPNYVVVPKYWGVTTVMQVAEALAPIREAIGDDLFNDTLGRALSEGSLQSSFEVPPGEPDVGVFLDAIRRFVGTGGG